MPADTHGSQTIGPEHMGADELKTTTITQKIRHTTGFLVCLLAVLTALVYLPGLSGPFVFDDYGNLLNNDFVKIRTLDIGTLYHSAYSLEAGPLHRPIAMLSFALNYYFTGSFADSTPYKLTNLAIHVVNTLLIFWLMRLVFRRAVAVGAIAAEWTNTRTDPAILLAAAVALLWSLHPIQLTSVLYVVQRMAELSALFTVSALICYMKGRVRLNAGHRDGIWVILLGMVGFGLLGVLSKENAALLPLFALVLEFTLFSGELPWRSWPRLSFGTRAALVTGVVLALSLLAVWAINYALTGYTYRPFTLGERVMTEGRVLLFYLSLIALPRISAFGLQHDDITLSTSLLNPWTTFASLVLLAALLLLAIYSRKRHPLLSLGILWYFVAHLLESTILSLEIAQEHRNYLAALGPILIIVYLLNLASHRFKSNVMRLVLPLLVLTFGGTTLLRAYEWSDLHKLAYYEARHHPNSGRAQARLASSLAEQKRYPEAIQAMRRASELDPQETGYLLTLHLIANYAGIELDEGVKQELIRRLRTSPKTTLTNIVLQEISRCILTSCAGLQRPMEKWLTTIIASRPNKDNSFHYNLLGRTYVAQGRYAEAIDSFKRSFADDPNYLHPLFELVNLYVKLGRINDAVQVLQQLRQANETSLHPRDREIETLASAINSRRDATATRPSR
jgi:tetratricopeptide (TPR) repeat protein